MAMNTTYAASEPTRADIDTLAGPVVLEFGAPWCGYCRAAQPLLSAAFADHDDVQHFKIEDGRGKPLGRSFRVKLWPTLVFLDNGKEAARLVRPDSENEIRKAFEKIDHGERHVTTA
ncbi:MAG TPA: thioredoxin family protein [Noviherbaspirillum sp.]|uniref:thioredoxin family protein n=1 Tax=Noviherbaspirillum sp. TaxID=1926288 RepID=UPI002B49E9F9|nr:thioredoxin family protein [Noviherbaspirillum sp.]HJV88002.1 thioredoxin family protein [Noviherbaspirillum sp.]